MDSRQLVIDAEEKKEEVHSLALDVLIDYRLREKRSFVERIVILGLWTLSLIFTVGIFIWYLNQYDFVNSVESTGVYSIVDSDGTVISSDIPADKLEKILELINDGKNTRNQVENQKERQ